MANAQPRPSQARPRPTTGVALVTSTAPQLARAEPVTVRRSTTTEMVRSTQAQERGGVYVTADLVRLPLLARAMTGPRPLHRSSSGRAAGPGVPPSRAADGERVGAGPPGRERRHSE